MTANEAEFYGDDLTSTSHLCPSPVAPATIRSNAVVLLLLVHFLLLILLCVAFFYNGSLFSYTELSVLFSFAIISQRQ